MNIAQVGNLGPRAQVLLSLMLVQSQVFRVAEFRIDASTHLHSADKHTKSGSSARAEGADPTRDKQTPNTEAKTHALYTREVQIDKLRTQDTLLGLGTEYQRLFADRRMDQNVSELALEVQDDMFAGDLTSNKMLGLLELIKDAEAAGQTARLGFTADELAAMKTRIGLQINTEASQDEFLESLEEAIASVPGANALIMNVKLGARFSRISRRHKLADATTDTFGQYLETYANIPIIRVPTTSISSTMSDGTNSDCTALIVARFAETQGLCYSTNTGFLYQDFGEVESAPGNVARADMFLSTTLEKANAAKVLYRIRL